MLKAEQFPRNHSYLMRLTTAMLVAGLAVPIALGDHHAMTISPDSSELEWGPCPEFMPEGCAIAVLHGDPAKPNVDVLFKLSGHTSVPRHTHTSAERMVLIAGEMTVRYEGQEPETIAAGNYAYGPPGLAHDASCDSDEDCVLFIAFEEPVDAMLSEE
jgi:quercetin dioxygenase-like cupin family protein